MKRKVVSIILSTVLAFSMGMGAFAAETEMETEAVAMETTESTAAAPGDVVVSKTEGIVDTVYGKVRGFNDEGTYTFRGIPYAKSERFGLPEAPDSWDNVLNCLVYGPTAPITKMTAPDGGDFIIPHRYWAQNENCQNLNVWTQSLDTEAKKPVLVWFHGGGFYNGSSIEGIAYDGKNLSEFGDVVVVTVNHRLNALGYLDLSAYGEEFKYSGNAGTADLVASLQWVKDNIANFGGDPENVTIFGQSGGGGKVLSMMSCPEAEGLFQRAIVQSGGKSGTDQEAAQQVAALTLEKLGLTEETIDEIKEIPYDTLDAVSTEALNEVGAGWAPVIDNDYQSSDLQEWSNAIPLMVGNVFGEMNCWEALDPNATNKNSWTDEEVMEMLTEKYGDNAQAVLAAFQKAWPDKNDCDAYYVASRASDIATLKMRTDAGADQNYNFVFSLESPLDGGVCSWHCSEIPFVFHNVELVDGTYGGSEDAYALQDVVASAWVNFAYNGDPNGENVPQWSTYTADNQSTMIFDKVSGERVAYDTELQELINQ